ncbi:MAG TPA: competence/damage-inducible protein A [Armatimonadota bacterium]|nr:competence/damage-inducible protein A [Armatimonadota bacterium]
MKAELVSVGTELLLGEITDTNAVYMSQHLAEVGIDVFFRHTVGDNLARIVSVLELALSRCDVVILCGGLGPTQDDLTREAIAEVTGRPLRLDPDAERRLREFFATRNRVPTQSNLKQATVPEGGSFLENTCGTAPGVLVETREDDRFPGRALIAVPGPPPEMREMFQREVLPYLLRRQGEDATVLRTRFLRLADIGESNLVDMIPDILEGQTDPTVAPYASPGEVKLRIATKAAAEPEALRKLDEMEATLRERLGGHIYGVDEQTMEVVVGELLRARGATLSVAESCTGGLVASRVTDVPGASDYFIGSVVSYSNRIKRDLLGVDQEILDEHGAVSEQCARAMAEGVRRLCDTDWAVATTGIAGPGGGSAEKPVGLVYIAVADAEGTVCVRGNWPGTRDQFKARVSQYALNLLRKRLLGMEIEGTL